MNMMLLFLKTNPFYSIILNVDNDHLDPYGPFQGKFNLLKEAFKKFALQTQKNCIINFDDNYLKTFLKNKKIKDKLITYSLKNKKNNIFSYGIQTLPFSKSRNYLTKAFISYREHTYQLKLKIPSFINVSNSLAVISLANLLNIEIKETLKIISQFPPIKRRFEIFPYKKIIIVDDYAHHPKEIEASLKIARLVFPKKRIILIFEPHRFSRVALLYKDFAKSLKNCDYLFLLEIDPSNEKNYYSVSSQNISKEILKNNYLRKERVKLVDYLILEKEILKIIKKKDVLIFMGPGKIGNFLLNFRKKYQKYF